MAKQLFFFSEYYLFELSTCVTILINISFILFNNQKEITTFPDRSPFTGGRVQIGRHKQKLFLGCFSNAASEMSSLHFEGSCWESYLKI